MEITPFTIYLLYLLENLHSASTILIVISIGTIFAIGTWFAIVDESWVNPKTFTRVIKTLKIFIIVGICAFIANSIIPNGKVLIGMYIIPKVVNNEAVQQLPGELLEFVRSYLKENQKEK